MILSKYRIAYVVLNTGHDFLPLQQLSDKTVFLLNGYEAENEVLDTLRQGLRNFDPEQDVVVPVGNVVSNVLLGCLLPDLAGKAGYVRLAIFEAKAYHIRVVQLTTPIQKETHIEEK